MVNCFGYAHSLYSLVVAIVVAIRSTIVSVADSNALNSFVSYIVVVVGNFGCIDLIDIGFHVGSSIGRTNPSSIVNFIVNDRVVPRIT